MRQSEINSFVSFTLAIILLFVGKIALNRSETLRKYSIPEPVIGGFLAGIVVAVIYFTLNLEVTFLLEVQPFLLLYFFAGIGLKADIRNLLTGGKPLLILTLLAAGYMLMQNFLGMGVAAAFGMDPKAGLMAGSVSLTGGLGTTVAWAPIFADQLGIANATEIGVASSTLGLIAACVVGGPIANHLINRNKLHTSGDEDLDIGQPNEASVIAAGFTGITLGTTATAIVSMTAVTKQYGAAHRAFLLVPLVGGFFIDIINAVAINFLANL